MNRDRFRAAIEFARALIRIPSLPGSEGAVATRVRAEMEALGLQDVRTDSLGNVVGVVRGAGRAPPVLLNAHLDIVAVGDETEWELPPFSAEVRDGCLHGRGAMDIKGPLALVTHAAASLRGRAEGDIVVAHTVFEERGGWGMQALLEAGDVQPAAALVVEATDGDVTHGHRGRAEIEVVLRGVAGHASAPDRAANAIGMLPRILEAVQAVAADQPRHPVLGAATVVPTQIDVRPESRNVIPDEVVVTLDWRILPGMGEDHLLDTVRRAIAARIPEEEPSAGWDVRVAQEVQETWTGVRADRSLLTPGFLVPSEHGVVIAAAAAAGTPGDPDQPATVRPWTFATDGGWTCGVFEIPTVGFAPGQERFAHTNRERLDLAQAEWVFDRYPAVISAIQGAVAG